MNDLYMNNPLIHRDRRLGKSTSEWVRSFACTEGHEAIPRLARTKGLKTMVGAWLSADRDRNERAAKEEPGNPMPHYYLGYAFKERGARQKAVAAFKEAIARSSRLGAEFLAVVQGEFVPALRRDDALVALRAAGGDLGIRRPRLALAATRVGGRVPLEGLRLIGSSRG